MQDRDKGVVAFFREHAVPNEGKSAAAGRLICDTVEVVDLRYPGSANRGTYPALVHSHWEPDPQGVGVRSITYAERFPREFQQFKARAAQTKSGTPLEYLTFLSEGKRAELRALNIYTAEALAGLDGQELKNLGHGGRELKNAAEQFLNDSDSKSVVTKLQADVEALLAKNATLAQDLEALKQPPDEYAEMKDEELVAHIKALTHVEPRGNLPRKVLLRMVKEAHEAQDA